METPHMSTSVTDDLQTTTATPDDAPLPGATVAEAPAAQPAGDERVARFIDVRGLDKTFSGDGAPVLALKGLDLTVAEGAFLGVMGQSGSGKSTFLSILPGERLADFRREYLGFVFQSFNLVPYLTALENVTLPLAVKKMPGAKKRRRALDVLCLLYTSDAADDLLCVDLG